MAASSSKVRGQGEIFHEREPLLQSHSPRSNFAVVQGPAVIAGGRRPSNPWSWNPLSWGARGSSADDGQDDSVLFDSHPQPAKCHALAFDGRGHCAPCPWSVGPPKAPNAFAWFHMELPRTRQRPADIATMMIEALNPPLSFQKVISLITNGPFCGMISDCLVFRVNSVGPVHSKFTLKLAILVSESYVVSVSLGRIPRLAFGQLSSKYNNDDVEVRIEKALPAVSVANNESISRPLSENKVVVKAHVLDFLLKMSHSHEADNPVPDSPAKLVVHILDTYVDWIQDLVLQMELDLDDLENNLDAGKDLGANFKRQLLLNHRLPKIHLSFQRVLQAASHCELMLRKLLEKDLMQAMCARDDLQKLSSLTSRLSRIKETINFLSSRLSAMQGSLDTWQSELINQKLYWLSVLSIIFLPLSIITSAFGMNIGGVPWVTQPDKNPEVLSGWRNVMIICGMVVTMFSLAFSYDAIKDYVVDRIRRYRARGRWQKATNLIKSKSLRSKLKMLQKEDKMNASNTSMSTDLSHLDPMSSPVRNIIDPSIGKQSL